MSSTATKKKTADQLLDEKPSADELLDSNVPSADEILNASDQANAPEPSVLDRIKSNLPGTAQTVLDAALPKAPEPVARLVGAELAGSARSAAPILDLLKNSPPFSESGAVADALPAIANNIEPKNQNLLERLASGQETNAQLTNIFAPTQEDILKNAQETGKVPYGKILASSLGEGLVAALKPMLPTNPVEAASLTGLNEAVGLLGSEIPFLGRSISDLVFRKNVVVPEADLPGVMKQTYETWMDTYTKGSSKTQANRAALDTFEQAAAAARANANTQAGNSQGVPGSEGNTLPSTNAPGGVPATELSIPGQAKRNIDVALETIKKALGVRSQVPIEAQGEVLGGGEPPVPSVPEPVSPKNSPRGTIEPAKPALSPSGVRYLAENMPDLAKVVSSIAAQSHPEHLQKAILESTAEAEAAKINGASPQEAEQAAIQHFVGKVRNGEIASKTASSAVPEAKFIGYQETGDPNHPPFALFNIPKGLPNAGSTVDLTGLQEAGAKVPTTPTFDEWKMRAAKVPRLDSQGIPARAPRAVVSAVDIGNGQKTKITHQMVLDEAKSLLNDELSTRAVDPLEDFVRSQGGVKGYRGSMEGEEFKGVPVHLRGPIAVDEMAQMAYHRGLLEEPSGDLLREKLKAIKPRGREPRLGDFYDQGLRNLEYYAQEGVGLSGAAEATSQDNLFQVPKENPTEQYKRFVEEGRKQGLSPVQAIKYAKERLANQAKLSKPEARPKQAEFGSTGGVEGFGQGKKGEQELFEPSKSPYQQELNLDTKTSGLPQDAGTPPVKSVVGPRAIRESNFAVKFRKTGELVVPHQKIESPADLAFVFKGISDPAKENFFIAAVKDGEVVAVEHLGIGTIDQTSGYPFEVLNLISKTDADSIIAAHNHPSGHVTPSTEDKRLTEDLRKVVENNGQKFLGHVIINDTKFGFISPEGRETELYHADYKKTKTVDVLQKYGEWTGKRPLAKDVLSSPQKAYELFKGIQIGKDEGMAFLLNTQNEVLNGIVIPHGQFTVKTIQNLASSYRSQRFVFINSGLIPTDIRALKKNLEPANIDILDDIISTKSSLDDSFTSRRQENLMESKIKYGSELTKSEIKYFQAIFGNEANRSEINEEVPSARFENNELTIEEKDRSKLSDFITGSVIRREGERLPPSFFKNFALKIKARNSAMEPKAGYGSDKEISEHLSDSITEIRNIVDPSKAAPLAAAITREQLGKMARSFDQAEAALSKAHKYFENQSVASKIDFIDRMEKGEAQATPFETEIAKTLRDLFDKKREEIQELGTGKLSSFIENYFPHIWDQSDKQISKAAQVMAKRPLEGRKSFLKKRSIDFFKEGVELGLTPASYNPIDLTFLKMREMDKYLMAHRTLTEFKKEGLAQFVRAGGKKPAPDWIKIDDRISTVMFPTEKGMVISGHLWAQPDAARIINNYLSPGLQKSSIYQAYRYAGNLINQFQLGLSFFHLGFTSVDSIVSKNALALNQFALGHPIEALKAVIQSPIAPIQNIIRGDKLLKAWRGQGNAGIDEILATAMAAGGGRAKMDQFYATKAYDQMKKFFQAGKPIKGLLRVPIAIMEASSKPILEYIVPRQKLGIFADIMQMELNHNPDLTHEEIRAIAQKAWDSVDNRMGQMVYDNLFWNRTFKDLLMASVRSVGWNLGTLREIGGGAKDLLQLGYDAGKNLKLTYNKDENIHEYKRRVELSYRSSYTIALPIFMGIMGAIYQYLRTGKGPQELKDYYFPRKGGFDANGDPNRDALPSYMKDIYHYATDPVKTILNKTNPLISMVSQMFQNKDFFGVKIRNEDDPIVKQVADEAAYILKQMIPFGIRNAQKNLSNPGGSVSDLVLPFVGITPAPYDINQTKAEKLAHRIAAGKIPVGGRTQEQADRSKLLRDITNRMKTNDPSAVRDLSQALKDGNISDQQMRNVYRNARLTPLQRQVYSFSAEETQRVYDLATPSEKAEIEPLLRQKKLRFQRKNKVVETQ